MKRVNRNVMHTRQDKIISGFCVCQVVYSRDPEVFSSIAYIIIITNNDLVCGVYDFVCKNALLLVSIYNFGESVLAV